MVHHRAQIANNVPAVSCYQSWQPPRGMQEMQRPRFVRPTTQEQPTDSPLQQTCSIRGCGLLFKFKDDSQAMLDTTLHAKDAS